MTLGIDPTRPDTGFGYIEYEGEGIVKEFITFKEKPDLEVAKNMIKAGHHAWNAGMFILRSITWLEVNHISLILDGCKHISHLIECR